MRARYVILPAVIAVCAIALGTGCVTEEVTQTIPPYASISDEARNPASAPTPSSTDDSGGAVSAIGDIIMWPFHTIGAAFGTK